MYESTYSLVTILGVSQADQAVILQEHNQYRGNVTPPATNMLKLVSK